MWLNKYIHCCWLLGAKRTASQLSVFNIFSESKEQYSTLLGSIHAWHDHDEIRIHLEPVQKGRYDLNVTRVTFWDCRLHDCWNWALIFLDILSPLLFKGLFFFGRNLNKISCRKIKILVEFLKGPSRKDAKRQGMCSWYWLLVALCW